MPQSIFASGFWVPKHQSHRVFGALGMSFLKRLNLMVPNNWVDKMLEKTGRPRISLEGQVHPIEQKLDLPTSHFFLGGGVVLFMFVDRYSP